MGNKILLDCTLRDGGYVNDWAFGNNNMVNIFERIIGANLEVIEVGFLDDRREFDINRSIMPDTLSVNKIYGHLNKGNTMVVGMIDYGTCDISNIMPCKDCFLDGIRVIFKKEIMHDAIAYCKQLKALGYQVFSQAVSITAYSDEDFDELMGLVNDLEPFAFSLVDTYGLLHKEKLQHYFQMADAKLKPSVAIGYHSHNNFQLAFANCIELLQNEVDRTLLIDGTLYGMGKSAGNAPIELLATYMNDYCGKKYVKSQLLEAIDVTMLDFYKKTPWGYSFKFFLSASNDCHPNYVSYLTNKKKLSVKDINAILDSITPDKKLLYDQKYAEELYVNYQKNECDDGKAIERLTRKLSGKNILLLGPGNRVIDDKDRVNAYIEANHPVVIAVNFLPKSYCVDYIVMSNAKRYVQLSSQLSMIPDSIRTIATSNVTRALGDFDYTLNYSSLLDEDAMIVDNPLIMLLKLSSKIGVNSIALAGFDGYTTAETPDYVNPNMAHSFSKTKAIEINEDTKKSLARVRNGLDITFVTESYYEKDLVE